MLAVTGRWAATLRTNHTPVSRVELWKTGTRLISNLSIESGTITKNAGQYPRTTATVTLSDTSEATAQLLTPFGSRLRFYRGVKYPDNTQELPLIADLDIIKSRFVRPDNAFTLDCADASGIISQDTIPGPYRPSGIGTAGAMIAHLIQYARFYGTHSLTNQLGGNDIDLAPDWVADGDPWDSIEQLADSLNAEVYFTPERVPILRPTPLLKGTPDAVLYALDGGSVTRIDSELARNPNVQYVWGTPQANGKAVRGRAVDSDPNSPTYVGGAYGRVVTIANRPAPLTGAQANAVAFTLLWRIQGKVRTVTLDMVPDPSLEPGDTVETRYANGKKERHVVQSVNIPVGGPSDVMTVTTRTTAYTTAGWP